MAAQRRPRGSMIDPMALGWQVERAAKLRVDAIATRAGVSSAVMFERIVEHVELTDQGVPVWWQDALPIEESELPIDTD
jgi:hypothetical protein